MAKKRKKFDYYDFEYRRPVETSEGIKALSKRGAFASNWWANRWIEALERLVDSGRLSRGRTYARKGQVLSIEEKSGTIEAYVQGSRRTPYKVTIQLGQLNTSQWEAVIDSMADQAIFTALLLTGEMPADIEDAFRAAGVHLFPNKAGDLVTHCSCPDWANPCKHVAATHYILGERFDEDPFLLFRLRGRSQEQILDGLRQRRVEAEMPDAEVTEEGSYPPLEETVDNFWALQNSLDGFTVSVKPPAIELPLLKRLGDPNFVPDPGLQTILRFSYRLISEESQAAAYQDDEQDFEQTGD